jgi:hypothetical protein
MEQKKIESEYAMSLITMVIVVGMEFIGKATEFGDGNGG